MLTKLRLVFTITMIFSWFSVLGQTNFWKPIISTQKNLRVSGVTPDEKTTKVFSLQASGLQKTLEQVSGSKTVDIIFPNSTGDFITYNVKEASNFAPGLAEKYPQIRAFIGEATNGSGEQIRISSAPNGIQTMNLAPQQQFTSFMQQTAEKDNTYVWYVGTSQSVLKTPFVCKTQSILAEQNIPIATSLVQEQKLRTFRLAVAASGEYTLYHGGTVAGALAAINATVTRVNAVFETDLAISLEVIATTDSVIFTDADTDPFTGNLITQIQNTLTNTIGEANYDIGHLFHRDENNGNAGFVGSVCRDSKKGSGYSSGLVPEGDLFDIDFVAHEMGHQFGANHTWSFEEEDTGAQMEPGSGSTIMGYAGISGVNNVAANGDDYFHYYSILQIADYVQTTSCAAETILTNTPPSFVAAPLNYSIPKGTAFVLDAAATDVDAADVLTYTWEQIDDGIVTSTTFGPENPSGANFRSLPPTTTTKRYFPAKTHVLNGALTQVNPDENSSWETLPTIARDLNFAVTVRDNSADGGQVIAATNTITVAPNAGPFVITSQNTAVSYNAGEAITVTWDVANTDIAPVNAQQVSVFLSIDGGQNFDIPLAIGVRNSGSHQVLLPGIATTEARIKVQGYQSVFYAVNEVNFSITEQPIVLSFDALRHAVCAPADLSIPFVFETYSGFSEETSFAISGLPSGVSHTFSLATANTNDTQVILTITNTASVAPGVFDVLITGTSASQTVTVPLTLSLFNTVFTTPVLTAPQNGASEVSLSAPLVWERQDNDAVYEIEVALDAAFTSIIETGMVLDTSYTPLNLDPLTNYFWRVKPWNDCGEGTFTAPNSFTTIQITCTTKNATSLPVEIVATGTPTVTSVVTFVQDLKVTDINVGVQLEHSYLADVVMTLTSPAGTKVVLTSNSCGDLRNMDVVFDDSGAAFGCGGNPALTGTKQPLGRLSSFHGESLQGDWVLTIKDTALSDGGMLTGFSLSVCAEGAIRPDADKDGVFDDGDDLCLGTPKGTEVTSDGCPIYRFAQEQFQLQAQSESCRDANNGQVTISAAEELQYSGTLSGVGVSQNFEFTTVHTLSNLSAGSYEICLSGTDGVIVYETYCYTVVILEPEELTVLSGVAPDGSMLVLNLDGAATYFVTLNEHTIQTQSATISLPLAYGENKVLVTTSQPCQGEVARTFYRLNTPILVPNPVEDEAELVFGVKAAEKVSLFLYSATGQLVHQQVYQVYHGKVRLNFAKFSKGIYMLKIVANDEQHTLKVIKQ